MQRLVKQRFYAVFRLRLVVYRQLSDCERLVGGARARETRLRIHKTSSVGHLICSLGGSTKWPHVGAVLAAVDCSVGFRSDM